MKKDLELVKFNLTQNMSLELVNFNKLKKEINELKQIYNLNKNNSLLLQIKEKEHELINSRDKFIKEFRINNQKEIIKYLQLKDQK